MSSRVVQIIISGVDQFTPMLRRVAQEGAVTQKVLGSIGQGFSGLRAGLGLGFGVGALGAGLAAGNFVRGGLREYKESEAAAARLAAVMRTTAKDIGLTVDQIEAFAEGRQAITAFSADATKAALTTLAALTRLRGEGLKAATVTAQDFAAHLGTDVETAAQKLGRALANPAAGMKSFAKSGIELSDASRDAVTRMLELNDVAGAQKALMAGLSAELKGAADETHSLAAEQMRLAAAWSDLKKSTGAALAPTLATGAEDVGRAIRVLSGQANPLVAGALLGRTNPTTSDERRARLTEIATQRGQLARQRNQLQGMVGEFSRIPVMGTAKDLSAPYVELQQIRQAIDILDLEARTHRSRLGPRGALMDAVSGLAGGVERVAGGDISGLTGRSGTLRNLLDLGRGAAGGIADAGRRGRAAALWGTLVGGPAAVNEWREAEREQAADEAKERKRRLDDRHREEWQLFDDHRREAARQADEDQRKRIAFATRDMALGVTESRLLTRGRDNSVQERMLREMQRQSKALERMERDRTEIDILAHVESLA